jgi:putative membrane protein
MKKLLLVGTAVLAMAATPAFAKAPKSSGKSARANFDQKFLTDAARGGMAEVELGKLAADKASSPEVRDFAKKMVDDHSKANDELKSLAQSKNLTLPTDISPKDKALRSRLAKLSGAAFDRAYMRAMVTDHRLDVNEFRQETKMGKDPDIKAFASKTLPTLEEHLKLAQTTDKTVVATSGTTRHHKGRADKTGTTGSNPSKY